MANDDTAARNGAAPLVVSTDRFGDLTVDPDDVIDFPDGLVGFAMVTQVIAVPVNDDGLFWWLQAVDDPGLAFLAVVPWAFFADYEPEVPADVQAQLTLEEADDALVYCLVTIHDDPRRFTANLLGPVIVNRRRRLGRQVVLDADLATRAELPSPA